jgi:RimJ/RimL family protein N-acetyltransferase
VTHVNRSPIESARLILRPPEPADAEAVYRGWATDPEVTRYVVWRPHRAPADAESYVRTSVERWGSGVEYTWLICLKPGGEPIGAIALRKDGFKANVGYVLARPHWNKGFMTEAVRTVIDVAFADPAVVRVGACCDIDNHASARVMEKAGMTREGILKSWLVHPVQGAAPRDCLSYSIVTRTPARAAAGR